MALAPTCMCLITGDGYAQGDCRGGRFRVHPGGLYDWMHERGQDAYLVRTDRNGNLMWAKTYGGSGNDEFGHVVVTSDGGFLASGTTRSYRQPQGGMFLVKADANGVVTWSREVGFGTSGGEISGHAIELQKLRRTPGPRLPFRHMRSWGLTIIPRDG